MRNALITALGALLSVTMTGCWFGGFFDDDEWVEPIEPYEDTWTDSSAQTITWSSLDADLGGHRVEWVDVQGRAYGGWGTTIEIDTLQGGTWAMFRLNLTDDLYDPELEDGRVLLSANGEADLLGCTGDEPYDYDYDGYADDVQVEVFQGAEPGTRRVDITATFLDGGERTVRGSVVLDLNARPVETTYDGGTTTASTVTWEDVSADVGDSGAYALSTVSGTGYGDGSYSSVEFETSETGQWLLFRLTTYDQDLFEAPVGATLQSAELMGCTGDAPYEYDYDGYADDVQVQILPGDGEYERVAHITGTFSTAWGSQSLDARVRYEVR